MFDLLYTIENISEIRDFELNRLVSNCARLVLEVNCFLGKVVDLCEKISQLEGKDCDEVSFDDFN